MEMDNSIFIKLINDMEKEIKVLKEIYKSDKQYVDEIDDIILKLRNIQDAFRPKEKILKNKIKEIDRLLNEIENKRGDIILTEVDNIYENVRRNLLDGMSLQKLANNSARLIVFENKEVGKIDILEKHKHNFVISVEIYDKKEEFEINDPIRTYNIISFINTNFNYK